MLELKTIDLTFLFSGLRIRVSMTLHITIIKIVIYQSKSYDTVIVT